MQVFYFSKQHQPVVSPASETQCSRAGELLYDGGYFMMEEGNNVSLYDRRG